jgi:hypothetical protein
MAAAALQIREQVSRQVGISTMPPNHATAATGPSGAEAANSKSCGIPSNPGPQLEITTLAAPPAAAVAAEGPSLLASTAVAKDAQVAATPPPAPAAAAAGAGSVHGGVLASSSSGAEPCAICFDEFAADDDVKQLPCGHYFHPGCIDEWLIRVSHKARPVHDLAD